MTVSASAPALVADRHPQDPQRAGSQQAGDHHQQCQGFLPAGQPVPHGEGVRADEHISAAQHADGAADQESNLHPLGADGVVGEPIANIQGEDDGGDPPTMLRAVKAIIQG